MKIVITGGTGFLGYHLKNAFNSYQDKHFIYYCQSTFNDLTSPSDTDLLISYHQPDVILHGAALCGGILANKNRPADFLTANVQMGINIFQSAKKYQVKKVYTLGSVCYFPVNFPVPFKEDDIWNGTPELTNFPYGHAKRTLLMLGNTYRQQYGIGGAHLIPVNLFGPQDHFDLTNSHVIPALINKFVNAVKNNLPTVECWGTGTPTREFLYAGDAAEAIVQAIFSELDTELPINLGTGKDISIKDLAELIKELTGFKGEIVFTGEVSDGQPKRRLDVSRAKELLGFEAKTSLREGLEKTINWYQENGENQ